MSLLSNFVAKTIYMEYTVKYNDVFEQCVMLSQFEGRDYHGDDGESLYLSVKITGQDKDLVMSYIEQGARKLEELLERMIVETDYSDDEFKWILRTEETRWNTAKQFGINVRDALKCYAMSKWLDGRKSDRVEAYATLYADLSEMCRRSLMRRMPPRRRVKQKEYVNTITIEDK